MAMHDMACSDYRGPKMALEVTFYSSSVTPLILSLDEHTPKHFSLVIHHRYFYQRTVRRFFAVAIEWLCIAAVYTGGVVVAVRLPGRSSLDKPKRVCGLAENAAGTASCICFCAAGTAFCNNHGQALAQSWALAQSP